MYTNYYSRNVAGGGETLEANWSYGVETSTPLHENSTFTSQIGTSCQVRRYISSCHEKRFLNSIFLKLIP